MPVHVFMPFQVQPVKAIRYDRCCETDPHTVTKISRKFEYCPPSLSYSQPSHSLPPSPHPSHPWPPPPPEAAPPPPHGLHTQPDAAASLHPASRGSAQAGTLSPRKFVHPDQHPRLSVFPNLKRKRKRGGARQLTSRIIHDATKSWFWIGGLPF